MEMSMLITLSCYFHNYTCILLHGHVFISVLLYGASCRCTYDLIFMAHFGLVYVLAHNGMGNFVLTHEGSLRSTTVFK
ncbi:hypothetical protein CUMW_209030 [Citrus unshiu]|uniref:Uncharacterized protein n=1 Tax=Citrus unshiu TaxID=55188 RepID=A0A2H5Q9K0_CITUN|nr:hypothetical protein CUMW_209030 [Citrus unshiu]